jgi:hypothetical protein
MQNYCQPGIMYVRSQNTVHSFILTRTLTNSDQQLKKFHNRTDTNED